MGVWNGWKQVSLGLAALSFGLVVPGCSGGGDTGGGDAGGDTGRGDAGGDTGGGDAGGDTGGGEPLDVRSVIAADSCLPASPTCWAGSCTAGAAVGVGCVAGAVVDETGRALGGGVAFVCFGGNCLRPPVDGNGFFSQSVDPGSLEAAVYFGGFSTERLTPYCRYQALCGEAFLQCEPFVLHPAPMTGTAVPETEMEALSQETTVEADDSARLTFAAGDALLRPIMSHPWVALTRYPLQQDRPCFVEAGDPPLALYAVTPADSFVVEPGSSFADLRLRTAALDLPNESGLAAGTEVEVYALGGPHAADVELVEGEWRQVTTATVDAEGDRIRTAPGQGIAYLTWFGIYAR